MGCMHVWFQKEILDIKWDIDWNKLVIGQEKVDYGNWKLSLLGVLCDKSCQKYTKNFTVPPVSSLTGSLAFVNTLFESTTHGNSQMTYIHWENNAHYLMCWASYGMENVTETSGVLGKRKMRGRCIAKLSNFARENINCCKVARDEQFSWNLNSDTD